MVVERRWCNVRWHRSQLVEASLTQIFPEKRELAPTVSSSKTWGNEKRKKSSFRVFIFFDFFTNKIILSHKPANEHLSGAQTKNKVNKKFFDFFPREHREVSGKELGRKGNTNNAYPKHMLQQFLFFHTYNRYKSWLSEFYLLPSWWRLWASTLL